VLRLAGGLKVGHHVRERQVVSRIVGDLPDQEGALGIGDQAARQAGADPLRAVLDPYRPA